MRRFGGIWTTLVVCCLIFGLGERGWFWWLALLNGGFVVLVWVALRFSCNFSLGWFVWC